MYISMVTLVYVLRALAVSAGVQGQVWNFERDRPGQTAKGIEPAVGRWEVVSLEEGGGHALAQLAKNDRAVFNVALIEGVRAANVSLKVRLRSIAGEIDQGGGLVWRAKDARNYYIARYNPLEDNLRVYYVSDGKRTQLANADIPRSPGWHTLEVAMDGDHIQVSFDGKKSCELHDATMGEPGRVGLWSKADAQTQFDDLSLREQSGGGRDER